MPKRPFQNETTPFHQLAKGFCCALLAADSEVEVAFEDDVVELPELLVVTSKAVLVPKAASKPERSIFSAFVVPVLEES